MRLLRSTKFYLMLYLRAIVIYSFSVLLLKNAIGIGLLTIPIGGTPYEDWSIVNYVDLSSTTSMLDYNGGNYTYDGHRGIDFTLANFAEMDRGVAVYAAASGTVIATHDGEFDRNTAEYQQSPNPNYIIIDHGNGIVSKYLHLKKYSLRVGVGDMVTAGQQIALVGSSGNSTDAHLHFEVLQNDAVTETYLNPNYWWQNPLPYSGMMKGSLDHGITDHVPSTPELRERPKSVTVFAQGPNQTACMWVQLHGINTNDKVHYFFYRPNGTLFANWYWYVSQIRYGWWCCNANLPVVTDLGLWRIDFTVNDVLWFSDYFRVIPAFNLCDFNHDAIVNNQDFAILAFSWNISSGQSGWNSQVDISSPKDNVINMQDLAVFMSNWLSSQ